MTTSLFGGRPLGYEARLLGDFTVDMHMPKRGIAGCFFVDYSKALGCCCFRIRQIVLMQSFQATYLEIRLVVSGEYLKIEILLVDVSNLTAFFVVSTTE